MPRQRVLQVALLFKKSLHAAIWIKVSEVVTFSS